MKTIHLVDPRTGPNNMGTTACIKCGMIIFNQGGSIAYDNSLYDHTTDVFTFINSVTEINENPCTQ